MKNFESRFEQTGDLFEWEAIGQIDTNNPEYQKAQREYHKAIDELAKGGGKEKIIREKFEGGIALVKKFQPYDPTDPHKKYFARDIRIAVQDLLGLEKEEDFDRIKFYTAVGKPENTHLDTHGIDAFLEYEDPKSSKILRVTFDLTVNKNKKKHEEQYRADIIVFNKDLGDPDDKNYLENLNRYAKQIVQTLQQKQGENKS
ncbi:MAG: hypothetical protein HZB99_01440 [Candidatus Harrisonbacteria bacterium]|nr:hypothetical protein [Candidatus Harrisonbacteria bacterium]